MGFQKGNKTSVGNSGRFQPGNKASASQRSKVSDPAKLAARVRRITKDGRLILDTAVAVMRDPKARAMEKIKAAELLKESGWGLASRGGETEGGKGNILINVVYYTKPPKAAAAQQQTESKQSDGGTEAQPSSQTATEPEEEPNAASDEAQTGGRGTHLGEFGSHPDGAIGGKKI